jgi:hypothetical protein
MNYYFCPLPMDGGSLPIAVEEDLVVMALIIPNHTLPTPTACSFLRGNKNEFQLDAGDQTKVLITMQKWHAAKNGVRCYQAVIRGA